MEQFSANARKVGTSAGVAAIFLIAVYISFQHIQHVSAHYGATREGSVLLPITIDVFGLIMAVRLRTPGLSDISYIIARIGLWFSLLVSLAFNVENAILVANGQPTPYLIKALVVSGLVVVILFLTSEALTHTRKGTTSTKPKPKAEPKPAAAKGILAKAPSKPAKAPTTPKATVPRQRTPKAAAATTEAASTK